MFRFTIRDLLWLMVVGVVGCLWFLHVRSIREAELKRAEAELRRSEEQLRETKAFVLEKFQQLRDKGIELPLPKGLSER